MSDGISDGRRARGLDDILATGAAWITERELEDIGRELQKLRHARTCLRWVAELCQDGNYHSVPAHIIRSARIGLGLDN